MELPPALRLAVEAALEGQRLQDLAHDAGRLSTRYRAETRDGRLHLGNAQAALAYLATRLPATFAAIRATLERVREVRPDLAPQTMLDAGAGMGTATLAAAATWPGLAAATLIEASPHARDLGQRLCAHLPLSTTWQPGDLTDGRLALPRTDLVILAYVLDELAPARRLDLVERLWQASGRLLVLVEPGTPAGWTRLMAARGFLLDRGAVMLAPCPHAAPCPLVAPDWCHFARRVARSRLHRQAKGGSVPWEDEKFLYLALGREAVGDVPAPRVLAPPQQLHQRIGLKLCLPDGSAAERLVAKRDKDGYRIARRVAWGDRLAGDA